MKRFFIKLALIVVVLAIGVWNYKLVSFNGGIKFPSEAPATFSDSIKELTNIQKIYYYNNPFGEDYVTIIETDEHLYLSTATQEELNLIDIAGIFASDLKPQSVTIIPWYVYLIVVLVIAFFPRLKRRK